MFAAKLMPKRKSLKRVAKNGKIKQSKVCRRCTENDLKTKGKNYPKRVKSVKAMKFCDLTNAEENELLKMDGVQSVSLDIESGRYIVRLYAYADPQSEIQKRIESHTDFGKHKFIFKKLKPNEDISFFASNSLLEKGIYSSICGTVGGYVWSDKFKRWYAATNKHVFPTNKKKDLAYGKTESNDQLKDIGTIEYHIDPTEPIINDNQDTQYTYDVALVEIHKELGPTGHCQCQMLFFEDKKALEDQLSQIREGNAFVFKPKGLTTELTKGNITEVFSGTARINVGGIMKEIPIFHSLKIKSAYAGKTFMESGDSGSLVYLKDNERRGKIMAMCYIYQDKGKSCLAFPFENALKALLNKYKKLGTCSKMHCGGRICGNAVRTERRSPRKGRYHPYKRV